MAKQITIECCGDCPNCIINHYDGCKSRCKELRQYIELYTIHKDCPLPDAKDEK